MKFLSRKLLVFVIATVLLVLGYIDSWSWVTVAMAYIGANYFTHFLESRKGGSGGIAKK